MPKEMPALMAIDIASPGTAARGYSGYLNGAASRRVFLAAIDREIGNAKWNTMCPGNVVLSLKQGTLPACLKEEPSGKYGHAHFHMFYPQGVATMGLYEAEGIFFDIGRMMANDGILFFSMDHDFLSRDCAFSMIKSGKGVIAAVEESAKYAGLEPVFSFYAKGRHKRYLPLDGQVPDIMRANEQVKNAKDPLALAKALSVFSMDDIPSDLDAVANFFSRFSDDAQNFGEYFAVMVKRK